MAREEERGLRERERERKLWERFECGVVDWRKGLGLSLEEISLIWRIDLSFSFSTLDDV